MNMDFGYNKLHKWRANSKAVVWANFIFKGIGTKRVLNLLNYICLAPFSTLKKIYRLNLSWSNHHNLHMENGKSIVENLKTNNITRVYLGHWNLMYLLGWNRDKFLWIPLDL